MRISCLAFFEIHKIFHGCAANFIDGFLGKEGLMSRHNDTWLSKQSLKIPTTRAGVLLYVILVFVGGNAIIWMRISCLAFFEIHKIFHGCAANFIDGFLGKEGLMSRHNDTWLSKQS